MTSIVAFATVCLGLAVAPGPNMAYLASRTVCQGRGAGLVSLLGVISAFPVFLMLTALGVTVILVAVPFAFVSLKLAGAAYLGWLAVSAVRNGASPFELRALAPDSNRRLFSMGFLTNILNPKAVVLYMSLLPQFIVPERGHVALQFVTLGCVQMCVSVTVNGTVILLADRIAGFLADRPIWMKVQRWLMATVLGWLAFQLLLERPR